MTKRIDNKELMNIASEESKPPEFKLFNYANEDETYLNDGLSSAFS